MEANLHIIDLPHRKRLVLCREPIVMGVLNVTPDSFSDGGLYENVEQACQHAKRLRGQGAHIIDIGGESTKPGATPITSEVEKKRILPVIEAVAKIPDTIISIDTYHPETAIAAVAAGAHIINDIKALQHDAIMAHVIAKTEAAVILMHNGWLYPKTGQQDIIDWQESYFKRSLHTAKAAGIKKQKIILDPGFGFGKDTKQNLQLIDRFSELRERFPSYPWLIGTSRKRFIQEFSANNNTEELDYLTGISTALLYTKGAQAFRVHNVSLNISALQLAHGGRF